MLKNESRSQRHPNQEDKSGNPPFGSPASLNSSTNEPLAHKTVASGNAKHPRETLREWFTEKFGSNKVQE